MISHWILCFFPYFFQTSQQFGIPSSTARQVLSLRFSRTSLGQTDHRGWGPSKARSQQEKEQVMGWGLIWESCQFDIYNLHISDISTNIYTYLHISTPHTSSTSSISTSSTSHHHHHHQQPQQLSQHQLHQNHTPLPQINPKWLVEHKDSQGKRLVTVENMM